MAIGALNEQGEQVDWWFMYKVSGESTRADGSRSPVLQGKKVDGTEYVYFDSSAPAGGRPITSSNRVSESGALFQTLNQVYQAGPAAAGSLGWFFYNDENPITGKTSGVRGHTKGVLAFDLESDSALWLIQSTPKFPPRGRYAFPRTGMPNAQTLLCISLRDAGVAGTIAKQMFVAQQPNVYLSSGVPAALARTPNDPRARLIQNQVASGTTPVHVVIPFTSRAGTKFLSIAKNRTWGLDFYNDLVGPTLHENLEVETWEHDPTPPPADSDKVHRVTAMRSVSLAPLGADLAWSEEHDHAKLTISDPGESLHYVCVGDINFTIAQRKRGGGTVAFQCEPLWKSLSEILESTVAAPPSKRTSRAAPARSRTRAAGGRSRSGRRS